MWNDDLEGAALRIAGDPTRVLKVVAGPGTGKTFTMMRRVARFLEGDTDPRQILVCTFTRTAAGDLTRSLAKLGAPGVGDVRSTTLHALCFQILANAAYLEESARVVRPLLDFEKRFMVEDLTGAPLGGVRETQKRLRAFAAAWARLQSDVPGWPDDELDQVFAGRLDGWLRFHGAMLIDELVPETLSFVRSNPLSPDVPHFTKIVIDEYQDLNRAEQELFRALAGNGEVTAVGDEDQSIYSFKHAHPAGMSGFNELYPAAGGDTLIDCRRCPVEVIRAANALIAHNATRQDRVLVPLANAIAGTIHVVQWPSMDEEADGIATYIKQRIDRREVQAGEVLVLSPRRAFGTAVRDSLLEKGIETKSFFGEQELDGNPKLRGKFDAQEAFTCLTLLANPNDSVALRAWCGFDEVI